jgi:hypothetical protein
MFFRGEIIYTLSDTPLANRIQIYSALDRLAKHELGYVWLTRNGLLRFSERDYFDDLSVNYPVDVDEVGMKDQSDYAFGANVINAVTIRYAAGAGSLTDYDLDSVGEQRNTYPHDFSADYFVNQGVVEAAGDPQAYIDRVLASYSTPTGEVESLALTPGQPGETVAVCILQAQLQVGKIIEVSETQVSMVDSVHLVLGEQHQWSGGYPKPILKSKYVLRNIDNIRTV